jgi:hypothetical protein
MIGAVDRLQFKDQKLYTDRLSGHTKPLKKKKRILGSNEGYLEI